MLLLLALSVAQATFDVASVKPVQLKTDSYNINLGRTGHGELTLSNVTLADCLKFAYGLNSDIQLDGPEWINKKGEVLFDIIGKAAPGTAREELKVMLQTLLTERFQLKIHHEQRQASYLALTQLKKGLKMQQADPATPATISSTFHLGHIETKGVYMSPFATVLSRFMRQPVIDRTGLTGRYVVNLDWTPDVPVMLNGKEAPASGPSIYTALQEQLGLKLEARKGLIDVMVIDQGQKTPIAN